MKKIYLLFGLFLCFTLQSNAQNTVNVDASAEIVGYANVFELPSNGGGFVFGEPWGVPDLKSVVDAGTNTITLQPNFNAWGDGTDPFWVDQATGEGNKIFEANTYVEDNSLVGEELTFTGGVSSNTIDAAYAVVAFIKVFNSDFSVLKEETVALEAGTNFSVTYTNVEAEDAVVQYGFKVTGVVADPANEAALGSVVVGDLILSVGDNEFKNVAVYPNPSSSQWNVASPSQNILMIELYDIMGKRIQVLNVDTNQAAINNEALSNGIYFAKIYSESSNKTIKLIKK